MCALSSPPHLPKVPAASALDDAKVYGWSAGYAKSGSSKCRITQQTIDEGALRIGKEVDNPHCAGMTMVAWYMPESLFASFRKVAADKPRIVSTDELKGFDELKMEDQEALDTLVEENKAHTAESRCSPRPFTPLFLYSQLRWSRLMRRTPSSTSHR